MNLNKEIAVDIDNVTKQYGNFVALNNVSLAIKDNEFFTLLGPSGCGKTTLLRSIAGFEGITNGVIRLYDENISQLPPNKRPVNTVFQNYALFPHMDITKNVMFGLERLGKSKDEAKKRALEVLEMVQLSAFSNRLPSQLSGGQQQRVALARALAPSPKVLLLDEPLSALDLKLRQAVRVELQQLQSDTGITFIFVTHDQEEALTMSDRIAIISGGELQQVGSPTEIYETPQNRFVANFIGETNVIDVNVTEINNDQAKCILPGGAEYICLASDNSAVGEAHVSVRPERIILTEKKSEQSGGQLTGKVLRKTYLGTDMHVDIEIQQESPVTVRVQNSQGSYMPEVGAYVNLNLEAGTSRLLAD